MSLIDIHINCDMGESFGRYQLVDDRALMTYIDACNIACGFHAGDPVVIDTTIRLAIEYNVEIGAHPSFPDLQGFGRRTMDISEDELEKIIRYQVGAMLSMVNSNNGQLIHVKPHGALYNKAGKHRPTAKGIVKAVKAISSDLTLFAPYHSILSEEGQNIGLNIKYEAFIDRRYNDDLSLVSRSIEGSVIQDPPQAAHHVSFMHKEQRVSTVQNRDVHIKADTYCIHGDNPSAIDILQHITDERAS